MSRKPIGWRMPKPLADLVWGKRRNQDTMVNMAGGVEKAASRITDEPLKHRVMLSTKREIWKRNPKKGQYGPPDRRYKYVCRDPKSGRFAREPTNEERRQFYNLNKNWS